MRETDSSIHSQGHVTSYYGAACEKYTSFPSFPQGYPVRAMTVHKNGVLTLSDIGVRMNNRRGPSKCVSLNIRLELGLAFFSRVMRTYSGKKSAHGAVRGRLRCRWLMTSPDEFFNLSCMTLLGKNDHRLAISGDQQSLFELDIERSKFRLDSFSIYSGAHLLTLTSHGLHEGHDESLNS